MINKALTLLIQNKNPDYETMKSVMTDMTEGKISDIQIAAFLTALKMKGETVDEICAACEVLKSKCIRTAVNDGNTLDIVGTGGDGANTFNISTAASFVASAGGVPVTKHGNRAYTSKCGSIDVLEKLGINVNRTPEEEELIFNKLNICFMFATMHHPAMKCASAARKELKFRTLFNILGPLVNPACAKYRVFGVYDKSLVRVCAEVLSQTDIKNAIIIHGSDGLDEATVTGCTFASELRDGKITDFIINPSDYGIQLSQLNDIKGGSPEENATIIRNIFEGKEKGAKKDIVVLNAALAFYIYEKTPDIKAGVELAREIIASGAALDKLNAYRTFTL